MSPRVKPRPAAAQRSSYREFRAQRRNPDWAALDVDPQFSERAGVFWKWATTSVVAGQDPRLMLSKEEQRVLSKASSAAGGYLVPSDFDEQIVALRRAGSVIGQAVRELVTRDGRTLPVGTATAHGTSTWTSENAAVTASDETFGQVSLGAFKATTATLVSEELLQDSGPDLDDYLADELARRQTVLEETAFAVGDGTGKPLGIVAASSGYTVVTAATGSATGFKLADVRAAYDALPAGYLPNASWLMSATAFSSLAGLTDSAGGLVLPSLHATEPSLYGRPVRVSPDMPATATNARSVVFGDLQAAYTVRRVSGTALQRQEELYSNTGQIGFRVFWRVDGRPVDLAAAVILRNSAT